MKRIETEMMIHFLYLTPMFVGIVNKDNIIAFMHGANFGKQNEPHWTKLLKEFISAEYKIDGGPLGWPNQVEIFSKKEGLYWTEGFKKLMIIMIKESHQIPFTKKIAKLHNELEQRDKERKIKNGS